MPSNFGTFDVKLAAGEAEETYALAESPDQPGSAAWFEGVIEEIVPQQTQGGFGYNSLPASVSLVISHEDWSGGAGLADAPAGTQPARYSYSRGIDASYGNTLYLSPKRQTTTGISTAVEQFYSSPTFGEYARTAQKVYQWSGGEWVERYDAGSAILTDMEEYGNTVDVYLVVARGDLNDIVYSTSGTSFGSTSTGNKYTFLGVRGHTSVNPVLVGVTATGGVGQATAIGTFTANDQVGSSGEPVTGIEVANDLVIIYKPTGVYTFDGVDVFQKLYTRTLYDTTTGAVHTQMLGRVFSNMRNRVVQYDPVNEAFSAVYLPEHRELNGSITAMTEDTVHMYFALTNREGNTYIMKGNPFVGVWHTWAYLGAVTVSAMSLIRRGYVSSTNDVLVLDYGGAGVSYFVLARDGMRPEDDPQYRFATSGTILGPLVDGGARAITKRLTGLRAVAEELTASRTLTVGLGIDDENTAAVTLLTAVDPGLTTVRITAGTPFTRTHYYATMTTADDNVSGRVHSIAIDTAPYPPRKRRFTMLVALAWEQGQGNGSTKRHHFMALRRHLFQCLDQQVDFTDPFGDTFVAKLRDVRSTGVRWKTQAQESRRAAEAVYQLVLDEITETTEPSAWAVYDESDYDDGRVYAEVL